MTEYKVFKGVQVKVLEGNSNIGKVFEVASDDPITPGTSEIEFIDVTPAAVLGGTNTPSFVPSRYGILYVNTTAKDVYVSVGATSASDWIKIN